MSQPSIAIKIDVDTERGTKIGVPNLIQLLKAQNIPATFYVSLGPDNTGRAIQRIFRPGFLKKVSRTNVISTYGIRTLLNGILFPGPHIGKRHCNLLRSIKEQGFTVGIHAYDHQKWQDNVLKMDAKTIAIELQKALAEFKKIYATPCQTAAAPGWQINAKALTIYDNANFTFASDCRGKYPFYPKIDDQIFKTLQIPTTLPTLDELLGLPELSLEKLIDHYLSLLQIEHPNVLTIHAELEGMKYLQWFTEFLAVLKKRNVLFKTLKECAAGYNSICNLGQGEIPGRSGLLAKQL